jgi:hypothetical protein
MTATDDGARLEKLDELEMDHEDLATGPALEPYDMPGEVAELLINRLAGWPAKRWRELAALLEAHVVRSMP